MNTPTNGAKHRKFGTIPQSDLPNGRKGKHHAMLIDVMDSLQHLPEGRAIKIPLGEYPSSVAELRSAIHRFTKKQNLEVVTSSDNEYFYVWKQAGNSGNSASE